MGTENPTKEKYFTEKDAIVSSDWSLACLSHELKKLTCELINLQTQRAHTLVFSGVGADNLAKPDLWTKGVLAREFKTGFPANFENFDNTLAALTPDDPKSATHTFRIGLLATLKLAQAAGYGYGTWNLIGICRIEYGNGEPKLKTGSVPVGTASAVLSSDSSVGLY